MFFRHLDVPSYPLIIPGVVIVAVSSVRSYPLIIPGVVVFTAPSDVLPLLSTAGYNRFAENLGLALWRIPFFTHDIIDSPWLWSGILVIVLSQLITYVCTWWFLLRPWECTRET